jgi:hypothetical protein
MGGIIGTGQFLKSGILNNVRAGSNAFVAGVNGNAWASYNGVYIPLNNVSSTGQFDDGNNFNTSTYAYVTPSAGVYVFGMHVYLNWNDAVHDFRFHVDGSVMVHSDNSTFMGSDEGDADDETKDHVVIYKAGGGSSIKIQASGTCDWHSGLSFMWGYQLY